MNTLIVSYGNIDNNSGYQIVELARSLIRSGCQVAIAVPKIDNSSEFTNKLEIPLWHFRDLLENPGLAGNVDLVHAWTTREIVRKFILEFLQLQQAQLVVHLVDNEEAVRERLWAPESADSSIPDGLSCPDGFRALLGAAAGVTYIHSKLKEFVLPGQPSTPLTPIVDFEFLSATATYSCPPGLNKDEVKGVAVCYTGNLNQANLKDLRILYTALNKLNKDGFPATLLKTGLTPAELLAEISHDMDFPSIDLGIVPRAQIPAILAHADICVQPGNIDEFNDYRLPSKIPEILAMGRPLITGACNIGNTLKAHRAAMVINEMTADNLATTIRELSENAALREELSANGLALARKIFSAHGVTERLTGFYQQVLQR